MEKSIISTNMIKELSRLHVITKLSNLNNKFNCMPYYKNYAAVSGFVHNVSNHEDAVRDILISEDLSQIEMKQSKKTFESWIEKPELSTIMPINTFISQPCGKNDSPDFIIKLSNNFILPIECKSSTNTIPLYNSGGVKHNYMYIFSSNITNETVTYMGSAIITLQQQELIDAHIKEARERDEVLNKKLRDLDINKRGISYYTRPMIGQSGGHIYTNYFTHENRLRDKEDVLKIVS